MKHIIHIFGASGSGTTTLGRAVAEKTGYAFLDSDDYIWAPTDPPFTSLRTHAERLPLLQRDLEQIENAVLSGSLVGWGDPLMGRFTLAVRLTVPADVRMARLEQREYARYGARVLSGGDMYEQSQAFLDWAARYDDGVPPLRSRALHDLWQRQLPCPVLILDGTRPVEVLAAAVMEKL